MKKFMLLHFGFQKPTPEIMGAWKNWFGSIADQQIWRGGLPISPTIHGYEPRAIQSWLRRVENHPRHISMADTA